MIPGTSLAPPGGEASDSTFDQRGQQVYGPQTNIDHIDTGGGPVYVSGVHLRAHDLWEKYDASVELVAHAPPADFVARTGPFEEARRWLLDPGKGPVAIVGPGGLGRRRWCRRCVRMRGCGRGLGRRSRVICWG